MKFVFDGVIDYMKKGIDANNTAIDNYKKSISNAGKDHDDGMVRMEKKAIMMLENGNDEMIEAIEVIKKYRGDK